jgi:class 3 adenylate cyclase
MDAEDVVDLLNDYFTAPTACIFQNDGTITLNALNAAAQMQEAAQAVSAARTAKGKNACEIGIGVHCGEVIQRPPPPQILVGNVVCFLYGHRPLFTL